MVSVMSKINAQQKINSRLSNKKRKVSPMYLIIIIAIALILVGGIAVYAFLGVGSKAADANSYNQVVTPDNVKDILAKMASADKNSIGSYEVNMNTTWTFKNSSTPSSDAIVSNNATNSNTVYFKIALKDGGKQVYKSPYMPLGSNLKNIVLDEKLSAGTYPAIVTYYLVDEKFVELSHVSVNMTLTIQN